MTEPQQVTIEKGLEAWKRIHQEDMHWEDWVHVARALTIGRSHAMSVAHTNEPKGGAYNKEFSAWMDRNGFGDMDKGDRSRLFQCMEHLEGIREWRKTLAATQRQRLNHPSTVWRHFEKRIERKATKASGEQSVSAMAKLKESVARLEEEKQRLIKHGGEMWSGNDKEDDIVRVLFEQMHTRMSLQRCENVAKKLVRRFSDLRTKPPSNVV
jgi:hypothetical protein